MRFILHIGQSKTGTSAIQDFLTRNRVGLRELGVLYPMVRINRITVDLGSHNGLADALSGKDSYPHLSADEYFQQCFEEAKRYDCSTVILSAEHFFGGRPRLWEYPTQQQYERIYEEKVSNLAQYLEGHIVDIIVYLRPQVDWLASTINQNVKIDRLANERRIYHSDRQFFEMFKPALRYYETLKLWQRVLLPQRIIVVPYVKKRLLGRNSITDFLERTGLPCNLQTKSSIKQPVNASLTREYVEVKKRLNRMNRSKMKERLFIYCLKRLSQQSNIGSTYKLEQNVVDELRDYVDEDNRRLSTEYLADGEPFTARGDYQGELIPQLSPNQISDAIERFRRECRSPRSAMMLANLHARAFLREHARPAHAFLHQAKKSIRARLD